MKKLYQKHKCNVILPLLLLIMVDIIAFLHITEDVVFFVINTKIELFVFTISTAITYYYLSKHKQTIRQICNLIKNLFKGKKHESK